MFSYFVLLGLVPEPAYEGQASEDDLAVWWPPVVRLPAPGGRRLIRLPLLPPPPPPPRLRAPPALPSLLRPSAQPTRLYEEPSLPPAVVCYPRIAAPLGSAQAPGPKIIPFPVLIVVQSQKKKFYLKNISS